MPSNCLNCAIPFSAEKEEVEWMAANSKELPAECPRCRAFKGGLQDESVTCMECGKIFIYPRELKLYSRMFNWPRPRRCLGGCRKQTPPFNEIEQTMSDFLKRLRSIRRGPGIDRSSYQPNARSSAIRRPLTSRDGTESSEQLGGSLAQALKDFQQKKRRRS